MKKESNEENVIREIIGKYFDGLYNADVKMLRKIFHPDTILKAPDLRLSLDAWLQRVETREVPRVRGDSYRFKILSVDVVGDQAMVKVECPLFAFFYVDFLGLLKENGRWHIVNKMYAPI